MAEREEKMAEREEKNQKLPGGKKKKMKLPREENPAFSYP